MLSAGRVEFRQRFLDTQARGDAVEGVDEHRYTHPGEGLDPAVVGDGK